MSILTHIPNGFSIFQTGLPGAGPLLQQAEQSGGLAWWLIILIAIIVLAVIFIPEMSRKDEGIRVVEYHPDEPEAEAPSTSPSEAHTATEAHEPAAEAAEAEPPPAPDNLTRIEGIGPRVAALLNEAGIVTFGQLAQADVSRLQELLQAQSLAMIDPSTWPEQAALAAEGNWEALDKLQDDLKGGRRA